MRVVLLTTDTSHHLYYAWQMRNAGMLDAVLIETRQNSFSLPTSHGFEQDRDTYERSVLLKGAPPKIDDIAPVFRCDSVNTSEAERELRRLGPTIVIVFGTGKISPEISATPSIACLNLHGGNPEAYRGLDSHLWAIYHGDFQNLLTTLHFIAPELDSGDIVFSTRLDIPRFTKLAELRAINTKACLGLSLLAVRAVRDGIELPSRPQLECGRYYSAMPAVLKDHCVRKFERFTATL